jgi:hypothetical protein
LHPRLAQCRNPFAQSRGGCGVGLLQFAGALFGQLQEGFFQLQRDAVPDVGNALMIGGGSQGFHIRC